MQIFLAITQEQIRRNFPRRDLYIKIDNNINFYLSTFPANINDRIFKGREKPFLGGHISAYFVLFVQREFFLKN